MLAAIGGRREAHDLAEAAGEMGVVVEAGFHGDGGDGRLAFREVARSGFHAEAQQILARRGAEAFAKGALELADMRFDLNWDALLRAKYVIEEVAVEGVQFKSKRQRPGRVAPPEPANDGPSFVEQLQGKALNKLDKEGENNILGDFISCFTKEPTIITLLRF